MANRNAKVLVAHVLDDHTEHPIEPAPVQRDWMDSTSDRFAYRCLPLVMANQMGWWIACPRTFTARWDGRESSQGLRLRFGSTRPDERITSHFGSGVLTFVLPYLFQTPRNVNLWVKGPSNVVKDGIQALEGVVETDWSPATFTMNWKFTRANHPVRFTRGEPICMIVPVPRGLGESLDPQMRPISRRPSLERAYLRWHRGRKQFLRNLEDGDPDAIRTGWQKDYMQGRYPSGQKFPDHQTRARLRAFRTD